MVVLPHWHFGQLLPPHDYELQLRCEHSGGELLYSTRECSSDPTATAMAGLHREHRLVIIARLVVGELELLDRAVDRRLHIGDAIRKRKG